MTILKKYFQLINNWMQMQKITKTKETLKGNHSQFQHDESQVQSQRDKKLFH